MDASEPTPKRLKRTPEQRLAAALADAARAEADIRAHREREERVVGAMVIRRAFASAANAGKLVAMIENEGLPEVDTRRIADLLERLRAVPPEQDPVALAETGQP